MDVYQNNSNLIVNQNNSVNSDKEIEIILASPWERILAYLLNTFITSFVCILSVIGFILVYGDDVIQILKQIQNKQIMTDNLSFFITFFIYLFIPL